MRVAPFAFRYQRNGATSCQYIDTTRKAIDCATTLPLTDLYNETLQQTFRPLLSKLSKKTTNLGTLSPFSGSQGRRRTLVDGSLESPCRVLVRRY